MARSKRRSNSLVVQVNPNGVTNYVMGILTGARSYVDGLMEGASLYNSWVEQEMNLEGTKLQEYKPFAFEGFVAKNKQSPIIRNLMMGKPISKDEALEIMENTNYMRVLQTDIAMKEAGKNYRSMKGELIKSKNKQSGIAFLNNYAGTEVEYQIPDMVKSKIKYY